MLTTVMITLVSICLLPSMTYYIQQPSLQRPIVLLLLDNKHGLASLLRWAAHACRLISFASTVKAAGDLPGICASLPKFKCSFKTLLFCCSRRFYMTLSCTLAGRPGHLHLVHFQLPSGTVSLMHLRWPMCLFFVDCIWHELLSSKASFSRANGLLLLFTTASYLQQIDILKCFRSPNVGWTARYNYMMSPVASACKMMQ